MTIDEFENLCKKRYSKLRAVQKENLTFDQFSMDQLLELKRADLHDYIVRKEADPYTKPINRFKFWKYLRHKWDHPFLRR